MPYAYQIHKQDAAYFLTPTIVEWTDALMRPEHKNLICESLNFCVQEKGLEIFAYVIMSSHMHMIARAKNADLSDIVRDFKKYTSNELLKSFQSGRESRKDCLSAKRRGCLIYSNMVGKNNPVSRRIKFGNIIIMQKKSTARVLHYPKLYIFI